MMDVFISSGDRCKDMIAFLFKSRLSELTSRSAPQPQARTSSETSLSNLDQSLDQSVAIVSPNAVALGETELRAISRPETSEP